MAHDKNCRRALLQTLLDVINQSCQTKLENGIPFIHHGCIGAYEDAFDLLEDEKLIEKADGNCYKILWENLDNKPEVD